MKVSTKGRYAIRALVNIAKKNGVPVSISKICEEEEISTKYMETIVQMLVKDKLLQSIRGAQGGYLLVKPANEYFISDILKTTEGSLAAVACLMEDAKECPHHDRCSTICLWEGLNKAVYDYLDHITIQDVLDKNV